MLRKQWLAGSPFSTTTTTENSTSSSRTALTSTLSARTRQNITTGCLKTTAKDISRMSLKKPDCEGQASIQALRLLITTMTDSKISSWQRISKHALSQQWRWHVHGCNRQIGTQQAGSGVWSTLGRRWRLG